MVSLRLENIGVDFPIYGGTSRSLKNRVLHAATGGRLATDAARRPVVSALRNISLELSEGDRLGLVGGNGAGKTTLLRIMSSVYEPTSGRMTTTGRVVSLFNSTLGMDLELPGYDNIVMRGMTLGLSRNEINRKMDEISEFTGLEDFLHLPVRTYSAGMRVRLAFAISTSVDSDIILLDEGVGAGDATFIDKAQARLMSFANRAGILVLATHTAALMRRLCNKAALLNRGEIVRIGSVDDVLEEYNKWVVAQRQNTATPKAQV